eukprot:TRINITY_DN9410_c1_g1_i1.p1 TRINITY_DN9410_c1_g1~~TRINITY_DN9410_c1_g1_i1.p1  ORF type:complete len:485 (+),score=130.39 TRINITY_DN9410_c1_g1_i1:79-1455(+)
MGIEMVEMERAATVAVSNVSAYERYDFDSDKISQPPLQKSELDDNQTDVVIVDLSNQVKNNVNSVENHKVQKSESEKQQKNVHFDDENEEAQIENQFVDSNVPKDASQICADKLPADLEIDLLEEDNSESVQKSLGVENESSNASIENENQFAMGVTADANKLPDDLEIEEDVDVQPVNEQSTNEVEKEEIQVLEESEVVAKEQQNKPEATTEEENAVVADKDPEVDVTEQKIEENSQVKQLLEQKEVSNEDEEQVCEVQTVDTENTCVNEDSEQNKEPVVQKNEQVEESYVENLSKQNNQEQEQIELEEDVGDVENSTQHNQQPLEQTASVDAFGLPDDLSAEVVEYQEKSEPVSVGESLSPVTSAQKEKKKKSWLPGFLRGRKNKDKNHNSTQNQDDVSQLQVEDLDNSGISTDSIRSTPEASTDSIPTHQEQEVVNGHQEQLEKEELLEIGRAHV